MTAFVLAATRASVNAGSIGRIDSSAMGSVRACSESQGRVPQQRESCSSFDALPLPRRNWSSRALLELVRVSPLGSISGRVARLSCCVETRSRLGAPAPSGLLDASRRLLRRSPEVALLVHPGKAQRGPRRGAGDRLHPCPGHRLGLWRVEVGDDGEYAPVVVRRVRQPERGEDVFDVFLDGVFGEEQSFGDRLVGASFGH